MSDTARLCELLQAQAQLLSIRIAAEGTKEYKADWLKNTDTVVRDGSGRFAKKGASSEVTEAPASEQPPTVKEKVGQAISDTKKVTSLLLEGGEVTVEMLKKLLTDKNFRRRAGLEAGQTGAQAIKRLAEAAKVNPELTKKLDSYINKFNEDLIKEYGDDGGAMAQAIRKHGNLPPGKDLKERLELQVAKYKAYEDALDSPEFYEKEDPKPVQSLQQKIIAASIPIAVSLGVAIVPEIIFAGAAFSLTEALIADIAAESGSFVAEKVMEKLDINNPVARLGIGLAVGSLAGGGAVMKFKLNRVKKAKDVAVKNTAQFKEAVDIVDGTDGGFGLYIGTEALYEKIKQNSAIYKKQIQDIELVIEGLEFNLDKLKALPKQHGKSHLPAIPKIEETIKGLNAKKESLINIADNSPKDAKKISEDLMDALSRWSADKSNKELAEQVRSTWDQSIEFPKKIKGDISEYYKGWGDLYKQLEDTYRELAMDVNRYHFNPRSKSIEYGDEVMGLEKARQDRQQYEEFRRMTGL